MSKRVTLTIAVPVELVSRLFAVCATNSTSASYELSIMLCRAFGVDPESVMQGSRKPRKPSILPEQSQHDITEFYPHNYDALLAHPHCPKTIYDVLVLDGACWGSGEKITNDERQQIALTLAPYYAFKGVK